MAEAVRKRSLPDAAGAGNGPVAAATTLRGRIASVRPAHLLAVQALFEAPRRWYLADGGQLVLSHGAACEPGETFPIDADGARLALCFSDGGVPSRADEAMRWSDYSGRSRTLAWSLAHEAPLGRLSEALGMALVPVVTSDAEVAGAVAGTHDPSGGEQGVDDRGTGDQGTYDRGTEDALWLGFVIQDPPLDGEAALTPCRGAVKLPLSRLPSLLARSGHPYGDDPPPSLGDWPQLPSRVVVGFDGPRISMAEWRTLQPGGVIVVGRAAAPPPIHAIASGRRWPVSPTTEGWRVAGAAETTTSPQESPMSESSEPNSHPAGEGSNEDGIRALPVQVRFDLGQLELSVGELAGLQPGYVFALPAHLQGANVTVRANGRDVGRGEIVAVGDTLGVRLLAWS